LERIEKKENETIEVKNLKKCITRYSHRFGRLLIPVSKYQNLIINLSEIEEDKYKWLPKRLGLSFQFINELVRRNTCLLPFRVKGSNTPREEELEYIWNDEMREKYLDFVYKYRRNQTLTRNDIEKTLDEFIVYLRKEGIEPTKK